MQLHERVRVTDAPETAPDTDAADRRDAEGFLAALVAAQRDGEAAVQRVVADRLARFCAVEAVDYDPAEVPLIGEFAAPGARAEGVRTAVLARLPGAKEKRSLILFAHPDSEPATETERARWGADPFALTERAGRLYGWGVADDLAGVAAGALAVERAARAGAPLGAVVFASTPSKRHARGVAALLHRGVAADAALYLHPAESGLGMGEVKVLAPGQLEFRVTVTGRKPDTNEPGHTAYAHLGVNALEKALLLIEALRRLDAARGARIVHPVIHKAAGRSTNLMVSAISCGEGVKRNRMPLECVFAGTASFPPGEPVEAVRDEIAAALSAAAAADPWLAASPPLIAWPSGVTGGETAPDHPFWLAVSGSVAAVTGTAPQVNALHASSDIRVPIVQKGVPTLGLGALCGDLTQDGRADEWVDAADFHRMVDVTARIVRDWCGQDRAA